MSTSARRARRAASLALVLLGAGASTLHAQAPCGATVRDSTRAVLCGRVVDRATGRGIAGGWVELSAGSGTRPGAIISDSGRFYVFAPAGPATLTVRWSCRRSVSAVEQVTLRAGEGLVREIAVPVAHADTACRIHIDRSDTSATSIKRWTARGPCFAVTLGSWHPALPSRERPARRVRLDTARAPGVQHGRVLDDGSLDESRWRYRRWEPWRGDSLRLTWSDDYSALTLTLGVAGDSLAGHGIWTYDVIVLDSLGFQVLDSLPKGPATARRIPCS